MKEPQTGRGGQTVFVVGFGLLAGFVDNNKKYRIKPASPRHLHSLKHNIKYHVYSRSLAHSRHNNVRNTGI